jgi:hypothetical protein
MEVRNYEINLLCKITHSVAEQTQPIQGYCEVNTESKMTLS